MSLPPGDRGAVLLYCSACRNRFRSDDVTPPHNAVNVIPLAVMCGGWLAPLLMFWLYVAGPLRPFHYPQNALAPSWPLFWLSALLCVVLARLPGWHDRILPFERGGVLYTALGVKVFRKLVPDGDWANRWRRRHLDRYAIVRNLDDARSLLRRTYQSERDHLMWLLAGIGSALYAGTIGWWGWALYLSVGNVLVNLYPILLQRYTRARLQGLLARPERSVRASTG